MGWEKWILFKTWADQSASAHDFAEDMRGRAPLKLDPGSPFHARRIGNSLWNRSMLLNTAFGIICRLGPPPDTLDKDRVAL